MVAASKLDDLSRKWLNADNRNLSKYVWSSDERGMAVRADLTKINQAFIPTSGINVNDKLGDGLA